MATRTGTISPLRTFFCCLPASLPLLHTFALPALSIKVPSMSTFLNLVSSVSKSKAIAGCAAASFSTTVVLYSALQSTGEGSDLSTLPPLVTVTQDEAITWQRTTLDLQIVGQLTGSTLPIAACVFVASTPAQPTPKTEIAPRSHSTAKAEISESNHHADLPRRHTELSNRPYTADVRLTALWTEGTDDLPRCISVGFPIFFGRQYVVCHS